MEVAARALPQSPEEVELAARQEKTQEARRLANEKALATAQGPGQEENRAKALEQIDVHRRAANVAADKDLRPPLADALVDRSIDALGITEGGARLPFALLALLAALATYALGVRIRGPRAGLLATLVLVACPLFIFQARQLASELGVMAGATLMMLGAVGLCSPGKKPRPLWLYALDGALIFLGSGLAYYDAGFFLGILGPAFAIALACAATLIADTDAEQETGSSDQRRYLRLATALSSCLALLVLFYFVHGVFSWVDAEAGEFSLSGHTLQASERYHALLGGTWKAEGDLNINFNAAFEQIVFGLFPWICLAPIAIIAMGMGGARGTNPLGARMLLAWAALAWVISSVFLRKVGPTQFVAVPAVALAIGIWLDELLAARAAPGASNASRLAPPLVALFVLFAGVVVAKDLKGFPIELLNVHLDTGVSAFPKEVSLHKPLVVLGIIFAAALFSGLYFWRRENVASPALADSRNKLATTLVYGSRRLASGAGRYGIAAAVGVALVMSVYLAQIWIPSLSTKLSSKATFSVYHALREPGNTLGIVGKPTAGSRFYADGPFEELSGRPALIAFLARPERVFALVRASELCPIHTESSKRDFDYYVVDDSNADKIMLSNRMWNSAAPPPAKLHALMRAFLDRNPLSRAIVRQRPDDIKHAVSANFDDQIELIGVDLPDAVDRGDSFEVTLYYKVLKPLTRNWQVFVHFDGGGVRFQGDHYPVNNRCGTNHWQPGDFIVDRFTVDAGGVTNPKTNYTVWTGFFVGSAGNWENMKAVSGDPDNNNRVRVGTIQLK